jgi:hypothetical protein
MKNLSLLIVISLALGAGAATPYDPAAPRSQIRDCPPGWVLVCESRRPQEPSAGGDEEIPEFDRCICEQVN